MGGGEGTLLKVASRYGTKVALDGGCHGAKNAALLRHQTIWA